MREILSNAISAVIKNIGLIASAEPDIEKRKILVRELAEKLIIGIQESKERVQYTLYDSEIAELDATMIILKKSYIDNVK